MSDSGPATTNAVASAVNSALNAAIADVGDAEIVALILAATSEVVGIPIVGLVYTAIVKLVVGYFGTYFYTLISHSVTALIIDIQTNTEASAAAKAFANLQNAVQSGDQNEITAASQSLDKAYAGLINYDGSASS